MTIKKTKILFTSVRATYPRIRNNARVLNSRQNIRTASIVHLHRRISSRGQRTSFRWFVFLITPVL